MYIQVSKESFISTQRIDEVTLYPDSYTVYYCSGNYVQKSRPVKTAGTNMGFDEELKIYNKAVNDLAELVCSDTSSVED